MPRRRAIALAGALALALLVGMLMLNQRTQPDTATAGPAPTAADFAVDLDEDGDFDDTITATDPYTGEERTQTIADLTAARDYARDILAPTDDPGSPGSPGSDGPGSGPEAANPRTSQVSLVPATPGWWKAITSIAPALRMNLAPYPRNAVWFSSATSRSTNPDAPAYLGVFETLNIAFETEEDLLIYLNDLADATELGAFAGSFVRGTILTFTTMGIDPTKEGYDDLVGLTPEQITDLRPVVGLWSIDYGLTVEHAAQTADEPRLGEAFTTFMTNLDLANGTTWSGIATNPTGPWTGQINGFDPDTIDWTKAGVALIQTATRECDTDFCLTLDPGISELTFWARFIDGPGTNALVGPASTDTIPTAPEADLRYTINWVNTLGVLSGSDRIASAYYPLVAGVIAPNGTQTLTLREQPANVFG